MECTTPPNICSRWSGRNPSLCFMNDRQVGKRFLYINATIFTLSCLYVLLGYKPGVVISNE